MSGNEKTEPGKEAIDLGGDELHRLVRWEYPKGKEPPLTPDLIMSLLKSRFHPPFWHDLGELAKECDAILAKNDFPPAAELNHGADGWHHQDRGIEPLSDCWYAAEIGNRCWHVLQDKSANHELQLQRILHIGMEVNDWRWRKNYRGHAVRGRDVKLGSETGGEERRKSCEKQTREVLSEMRRLTAAGHSIAGAADAAARKGIGTSKGANRKLWYKYPDHGMP